MKKSLPWIALIFSALWLASSWRMPKAAPGGMDMAAFGRLPVLVGGRVKPLDTVARNALVIIHGRQTLRLKKGGALTATQWLAETLFNAPAADQYPVFVINNPEVLGLFGWKQEDRKDFSFAEVSPFLQAIDEQGRKAEEVDASRRSPFQNGIYNLRNSIALYQRLKNSAQPAGARGFAQEIEAYIQAIPDGLAETGRSQRGEKTDQAKLNAFAHSVGRYQALAETGYILAVPPPTGQDALHGDWISIGASLLRALEGQPLHPVVTAYARLGDAYRGGDAGLFNRCVEELAAWMKQAVPRAAGHAAYEFLFNHLAPFYQCMCLYVLAFLLVSFSWLSTGEWNRSLGRAAFYVLALTLLVHSFGLVSRMILQGRPPVTNLYSSAVFIGWGTVLIGLILERIYRDGIGSACASVIGFITLIIAHHLAASGDTMEMLVAVLDTNIWLATHVVCITIGYSAMFLAGMLALCYVVRGLFTRSLSREAANSLARMVYGVICFATLFSFVGTVLGGIWADQSWGRFWGWDPKENGALLIVLWCAVILHARWGGIIRHRGLMILALFGNVITSFSWFGVNMLGVGLHSYGFMNRAFPWLVGFMLSQIVLMALAGLPLSKWRSFRAA